MNPASNLMAALYEFESQRQMARVMEAATDGEAARNAALMAEVGDGS